LIKKNKYNTKFLLCGFCGQVSAAGSRKIHFASPLPACREAASAAILRASAAILRAGAAILEGCVVKTYFIVAVCYITALHFILFMIRRTVKTEKFFRI